MKYTIAEALHEMRRLRGADAGRLRGVEVQYHWDQLTNLDRMPQPWGTHLAELIEADQAGRIGAESPAYVVVSDGLPVAWLTVHAAVVAPTMPMMTLQAKHQRQTAAVLAELDRQRLQTLADARDRREGRPVVADDDYESMVGALRVAQAQDPTRTRWIRVSADVDEARREFARAVGGCVEQAMIVEAVGYGHHGHHAHRLTLELICVMQAVAAAHPVTLNTVGDWIDHEYGLAGQVDPQTHHDQFAAAYIGRFASRAIYTSHRMDEQGWTAVLRPHGMQPYFDTRRYEQHLFSAEVFDIDHSGWRPGHGIDVFRRPKRTG